jgi:hypothetical protein
MKEQDFIADVVDSFRARIEALLSACESPIERTMLAAIMWHLGAISPVFKTGPLRVSADDRLGVVPDQESQSVEYGPAVSVVPQLCVDLDGQRYRIDIAIRFAPLDGRPGVYVAIECDGHDFHERTKEQASRDKARDRAFQAHGWIVARFTGSDIWRDAHSCAAEAVDFIAPRPKERT